MQPHRPILTQHRRQRLVLWALTLLQWFAGVLFDNRIVSNRHLAQRRNISLRMLTRIVTNILLRAAAMAGRVPRLRHRWRHGRDLCRAHFRRSLLGAALRRALKHKDIRTHIARLIALLRHLDRYAARLARRLRRLHRLWRIAPAIQQCAAHYGAPASPPAFSDTS